MKMSKMRKDWRLISSSCPLMTERQEELMRLGRFFWSDIQHIGNSGKVNKQIFKDTISEIISDSGCNKGGISYISFQVLKLIVANEQ